MTVKRRHHYIPVCVLKNFTTKHKISIYSKRRDIYYTSSPKKAFAERDLNRLPKAEGLDEFNGIEDIFDTGYEGPASAVIQKIITAFKRLPPKDTSLNTLEYVQLLNFIGISIFRTPHMLRYHEMKITAQTYSYMLTRWYFEKGNFNFPDCIKLDENSKYAFIKYHKTIAKDLAGLKMCVNRISNNNEQLLLGDSYVNIYAPSENWLKDDKLEIHFPISPQIMLSFCRANPNVSQTVWHELKAEEVNDFNSKTIASSFDLIGAASESYLKQEILKKKDTLNVKHKCDFEFSWTEFKESVINEIKRFETLNDLSSKIKFYPHVNDDLNFQIYNEEEMALLKTGKRKFSVSRSYHINYKK